MKSAVSRSSTVQPHTPKGFARFLGETRSRIFSWYVIILGVTLLTAVPAFLYFLQHRIDERVRQDMLEDIRLFRALVAGKISHLDLGREEKADDRVEDFVEESEPNENLTLGALSFSAPPKTTKDLENLFRVYLLRRLPEDESYFITFIDGKFYKSSPRARPRVLARNSMLMQRFATKVRAKEGFHETADLEIGKVLYLVEPINMDGRVRGIFVVAHATAGERAEALESISTIIQVFVPVFMVAIAIAWLAAGRVLSPLRTMMATAHAISETDLTQRLPVDGGGELAELALTFNDMMDRLETAFATQQEFVNDAGHELRTPITIIRGHLELMGEEPQEQEETLQIVMSELDRMSRIVDDLILLAKAERTDFLQLEAVDAGELTNELYVKATALAKRNWQLENVARGRIVVDRQRITEAVMNLAQNATQHTSEDDTITLGSGIAKGKVRFWVRDTGEGILDSEQQRIFERFARVSSCRRRSEGAGLGLAIVRAIAEAHGGQIQLRSQFGTGSTFTLVLPVDPPQEVNAHVAYSHRRR